jgi:hypothetical protein
VRVYLVQHGQSKSEEEDPQRRLTDKGIWQRSLHRAPRPRKMENRLDDYAGAGSQLTPHSPTWS